MDAELKRILRAMRRLWWIPVVLALVVAPLAWAASKAMPETYVASTQLMITNSLTGEISIISDGTETQTFLQLVESGPVLDRVILEFGLDMNRFDLEKKIEARILPGTEIIEIQVRDSDPQLAADLTNAIGRNVEIQVIEISIGQIQRNLDELELDASVLRDRVTVLDARLSSIDTPGSEDDSAVQAEIAIVRSERLQLQQAIADVDSFIRRLNTAILLTTSTAPIVIVDDAQPPTSPEGPNSIIFASLGFLLGGLIGACVMLFLEYRDHSVRTGDDLAKLTSSRKLPELSVGEAKDAQSERSALFMSRVGARVSEHAHGRLLLVTARANDIDEDVLNALSQSAMSTGATIEPMVGILESGLNLKSAGDNVSAFIVAQENRTNEADATEVAEILRDLNVPIVGSVLLTSK